MKFFLPNLQTSKHIAAVKSIRLETAKKYGIEHCSSLKIAFIGLRRQEPFKIQKLYSFFKKNLKYRSSSLNYNVQTYFWAKKYQWLQLRACMGPKKAKSGLKMTLITPYQKFMKNNEILSSRPKIFQDMASLM